MCVLVCIKKVSQKFRPASVLIENLPTYKLTYKKTYLKTKILSRRKA